MRNVTPEPSGDPDPMPRYVGQSWFVHWWPWFMVVFGLVQVLTDKRFAGYAILFALCGFAFAWLLPWRFVVVEDGIGLWFTFGRRRFLPKSEIDLCVRGSAHRWRFEAQNRRFGYPLSDGFFERRRRALTEVLTLLGFRLA